MQPHSRRWIGRLLPFLLTSLAACSTDMGVPTLPTPPPAPILTNLWMFATKPPAKSTAPKCPEWEATMVNEDLAAKFEDCRAAVEIANARVTLWETWADGEVEAQRKGRN